jgi:hypothetical protein
MIAKHRYWQRSWAVDIDNCTATHESGLSVRYLPLPSSDTSSDELMVIGKCWTDGSQQWEMYTSPKNFEQAFETLRVKNGIGNATQMMARLKREAGEIWTWRKAQKAS